MLTTGRQDWGVLRSTCLALRAHPGFALHLIVGGMHLARRYGRTVDLIAEDGFEPGALAPFVDDDAEASPARQAGAALTLIAVALERACADALLVVGDRFETLAAATAAVLQRVPTAHLHGGERTLGSLDDRFRAAITSLSSLHLVSHPEHARTVVSLGAAQADVHVVGAPGLDNLHRPDLASRAELERRLGLSLEPPVVVVTLHPATADERWLDDAAATVAAMDRLPATYVVTLPNSDAGADALCEMLSSACQRPRRVAVPALGERAYWGLMKTADAMLGNSSSALIEAPILALPAVNVGERQRGRLRADNVLDAPAEPGEIALLLQRALDPSFRARLSKLSPYGDGRSAERIRDVLLAWRPAGHGPPPRRSFP